MTDEPMGSILDILGMDQEKMAALAARVGVDMLVRMEPALVQWVQDNADRTVQSLIDGLQPALSQWISTNAAPAVQSLIDTLRVALSQ